MSREILKQNQGLTGEINIPGDKSVSHRSVMFAGLADTPVYIKNFLPGADCLSTASCMRALGVRVETLARDEIIVCGNGLNGLKEPQTVIDAGNSGTTLRLMLGILAAQPFLTTFTGDVSLSQRPMGRVVKPLKEMGAIIFGRDDNNKLPLTVVPAKGKLRGIRYDSPVASAQVKSAILLAGLWADSPTTVIEPYVSRNHTEEMLTSFGVRLERSGAAVTIYPTAPAEYKAPATIEVPGDISSAAFWFVAAAIVPNSKLVLKNVGVNQTRTGIIDVLRAMGAKITLMNERRSSGETVADIEVLSAPLRGTNFGADIMPRLVDEIPVIAVAAIFAEGDTVITGAGELRVKETDRLKVIATEFGKLAPSVNLIEELADGLVIHGQGSKTGSLVKATADSCGDHRIAMSLAVLGSAGEGVIIEDDECVNISYPEFYQTLSILGGGKG